MDTTQQVPIDKSGWGDGPWQHEPDRAEWTHAGLPCLALRNENGGGWCGYVAVPQSHPLHGKNYEGLDIDVHYGLSYSAACQGRICHVPQPSEPDDVWWLGFDCAHYMDLEPARLSREERFMPPHLKPSVIDRDKTYRTLDYVQAETNRLAEQLNSW